VRDDARQRGVGRGEKEWKKGGKTRSSYNKTPHRVSQVEVAICVRERVAGNEKAVTRRRGGEERFDVRAAGREGKRVSVGYTYVYPTQGTMYSNCEEKGCNLPRGGYIGDR